MKKFVVCLLVALSVLGSLAAALEMTSPTFAGEQKGPAKPR